MRGERLNGSEDGVVVAPAVPMHSRGAEKGRDTSVSASKYVGVATWWRMIG